MMKLKKILIRVCGIGFLLFIVMISLILSKFDDDIPTGPKPRYLIILGAKVRPDGISPTLKRRLDRALPLLLADTSLVAVVSGGKGSDEPVSEAQAMSDYLIEKGVFANQIIREDQSFSTEENLRFSRGKIDVPSDQPVAIWLSTSNYHQYRSQLMARKMGFIPYGIPCSTPNTDLPRYLLRETAAIVANWLPD